MRSYALEVFLVVGVCPSPHSPSYPLALSVGEGVAAPWCCLLPLSDLGTLPKGDGIGLRHSIGARLEGVVRSGEVRADGERE